MLVGFAVGWSQSHLFSKFFALLPLVVHSFLQATLFDLDDQSFLQLNFILRFSSFLCGSLRLVVQADLGKVG